MRQVVSIFHIGGPLAPQSDALNGPFIHWVNGFIQLRLNFMVVRQVFDLLR